jgi:hypothetical protein
VSPCLPSVRFISPVVWCILFQSEKSISPLLILLVALL